MPGNLPKEEVSLEAERASLNVKDIVSIARKNFIPGNNIRGGVKSIASQLMGPSRPFRRADKKMWYDKDNGQCFEIKADQDKDELKLSLGETFHIVDPRFTGYVNVVYDTNFTLGEGPRGDKEKVSQLLANTIDNPEFPIKNIFALGAYTGRMGGYIDFYPYFVKKQSDGLGRQRQRFEDLGQYQLIVKENRGEATAVGLNKDDYVHHEPLSSKITVIKKNPLGSQEEETLHVELINLIDGQGIPSENLNQNDLLKNKLLQLFEISQHKKVYVHCQAGIGRTGHLVLTFLLLNR